MATEKDHDARRRTGGDFEGLARAGLFAALLDELASRIADEIERRQDSRPRAADAPPAEPVPAVLSPEEAAAYLRVGVNRMRDMLRTGEIEGWRRDGERRWHVSRAALDRYVVRQEGRDGLTMIAPDRTATR